ncbi:MAG: hypothetical protein HFF43_02910 [Lawsonibacter sp.]|nr:hypothetical protein [Lawsonibacter sp.]
MKHTKRFAALALALALALSGCGKTPGGAPGSSSGSASGSGSGSDSSGGSSQVIPMELSQVTDPYLATSGFAGGEVVAKINGDDITVAELLYWLNAATQSYLGQFYGQLSVPPWEADLGDGATLASQMKEQALNTAVFYRSLYQMASQEGLAPDSSVASDVNDEYASMVVQMGKEELVDHMLWMQLTTLDQLIYLNQCSDLYAQLQELYYGEDSGSYPTDADVNAYLDEGGYFRVKHILLMTIDQETNEPLPEEEVAQKKADADGLLAQLRAAEDPIALFDQLMKEHSEDGGLESNPDGYIFDADDSLVGGFREATLALSVGEISDVVETDYGYHIMLRLPLDPADYRSQFISQQMDVRAGQWKEDHAVEKTELYDKVDPAAFWDKCLSLQAAVQAELTAKNNG